MNAVEAHDDYFMQKRNAAGVLGLSCFQKVTAALHMLTYGVPADATDEYIRIGESTALESLHRFVVTVVEIFEEEYLMGYISQVHLSSYGEQEEIFCQSARSSEKGCRKSFWGSTC